MPNKTTGFVRLTTDPGIIYNCQGAFVAKCITVHNDAQPGPANFPQSLWPIRTTQNNVRIMPVFAGLKALEECILLHVIELQVFLLNLGLGHLAVLLPQS